MKSLKKIVLYFSTLMLLPCLLFPQTPLGQIVKRAEAGDAAHQYVLAKRYKDGDGVSQDYTKSIAWLYKAIEQGYTSAYFELGLMHSSGRGFKERDYVGAAKWWHIAGEQGYAKAYQNLGGMYRVGRGVQKDVIEAYACYIVATDKKARYISPSQVKIIKNDSMPKLKKMLTPDQISEAKKRARKILRKIKKYNKKL